MIASLIEFWPDLLKAALDTLMMVSITMAAAILIGTPLGLLLFATSKGGLSENRAVNTVAGWLVNVLRSFPFIILMVVLIPVTRFIVGTSIGPKAAALSLSVSAIPYFARLVEQNLREVPRGLVDAAISCGASTLQVVRMVLVPEALPGILGSLTITTVGFIAYSAVAGAIGAGGLGDLAIRYGYYRFETWVMIWCVVVMVVLVQLTQWLGNWLVARVDHR